MQHRRFVRSSETRTFLNMVADTMPKRVTRLPAKTPGPPPHTHERKTDMFFVLEGTLSVLVEDDWRELGPGSFVAAPPGVRHSFRNDADAPVRFLNMSTPGGWERYMREVAEIIDRLRAHVHLLARCGNPPRRN